MKLFLVISLIIISSSLSAVSYGGDEAGSYIPCMVTGHGNDSLFPIYQSPSADAKPIADVTKGETRIIRLGPETRVGTTTWFKVHYDDVTGWMDDRYLTCRLPPREAQSRIEARAQEVIRALKAFDMEKFSTFVHPIHGVRFSPYAYVEPGQDLVFTSKQVAELPNDREKKRWGYYDGSGEPIKLSFSDYYRRFVFDRDFSTADRVSYNHNYSGGNTADNSFEVYPGAIVVEFFISGSDSTYQEAEWRSLRLAFEKHREHWYVVGIIHDEWTI